ncbi:MAG: glycosyltransferase family 4 protein [Sulfuricella sp.]|nr:glycosyltransferase family 4 protein [Sulfuricella sp.]
MRKDASEKPLNIALIRQRYTDFGGAERFVARAMEGLRQQGLELTIITRQWAPDSHNQALICNPFYLGSIWRDWSFARCVCTALKTRSFDLVQSHERIPCCDLYRAGDGVHREWLKQRRRSMGILGKLGIALNPYHHYVMAAEKALFSSPSLKAVICNSRMVKDEIQSYFGIPEDRLHVIYSGIDTQVFYPGLQGEHRAETRARYKIPLDATLFLFVGSGFERKGLRALLTAMTRLPESSHLLIVGKDKNEKAYRQRAENMDLGDRVHFAGGQKDARPFYGAADAFALPTLYDPFPNTVLEAFACGLPVITSTKSGAAELINDGENGYVCDALDVACLAAAMSKLLSPSHRGQLAAAALNTIEPLSLDNMSIKLSSLYESLLNLH